MTRRSAVIPLLALLALAFIMAAYGVAFAQFNGCPRGFCNQTAGSAPPASDSALLLEDGTNYLLLEDGTSTLCLEGGC